MSIHLTRDLEALQHGILSMCGFVEEMLHNAVDGLLDPSPERAWLLAQKDDEIDELDVKLEEDCLKILALHQPVATDLRRTATVFKIVGELERVADLAVHIAERSSSLVERPEVVVPEKLQEMVPLAVGMLHRSIDSFVELDSGLAREVCLQDEIVDRLNREVIADLVTLMQQNPDLVEPAMHLFSAARHVERVADHATNIAEDVVYLVEGVIIRHRTQQVP